MNIFIKTYYMKILLFVLLAYGITNIAIFGSIFQQWRDYWERINPSFMGKLTSCPMCLSFYVGLVLSIIFNLNGYSTPFFEYGIKYFPLLIFLDACFTSSCVWLIHTVQEAFERAFQEK